MFLLDNLKSLTQNNYISKIENKLRYLYTLYIFYFFLLVFVLSFFTFLFIQNFLKPKGITLNLPSSNSKFFISQEFKRVIIKVTAENLIYFNTENTPVETANFVEKIDILCDKNESCQIFLMFDKSVMFENVVNVISYLRGLGYKYVAILTE